MGQKEKPKAQDIVNKTNYVFQKSVGAEEAYPEIENLLVKVKATDGGYPQSSAYTLSTFRQMHNCPNTQCYGGGCDMGKILEEMVKKSETEKIIKLDCIGHEGTKTKVDRSCACEFELYFRIDYIQKADEVEESDIVPE
jgi:hypothetical protein